MLSSNLIRWGGLAAVMAAALLIIADVLALFTVFFQGPLASWSVLRTGSRPPNPPSVITGSSLFSMIGDALLALMVATRYLASPRLACR